MSRQSATVSAALVSMLALSFGYWALRPSASRVAHAPASSPVAPSAEPPLLAVSSPTPAADAVATSSARPIASSAPQLDEPALMQRLRELRRSDPTLTLSLARQGNERFEGSADAAERAWFVVKALSDLGRHDEARVEGRRLVDTYRGTRFAEDVYRHLFVNPGTHPFERGYGKQLESDP